MRAVLGWRSSFYAIRSLHDEVVETTDAENRAVGVPLPQTHVRIAITRLTAGEMKAR